MRFRTIILALTASLALAGCHRAEIAVPDGIDIAFSSSLRSAEQLSDGQSGSSSAATKTGSTLIDTDSELQGQAFGIYGYKSVDDATDLVNVFTSTAAQKVYYTTSALTWTDANGNSHTVAANTWNYDDHQKWERAKHYRFRAFWPYTANVNTASTAKFLAIEYRQVEDYDLLVAYATRYPMSEGVGRVPMTFKHALAGLRFKFRFKEDDKLVNISDQATSFYVTGLFLSGTLIYGEANTTDTAETIRWNIGTNNFDSTTQLFSWTGSETFAVGATKDDKTVATIFDDPDRVVFAIPQTLSEYSYRETYAHFTTRDGGTAVQNAKIPKTTLEPGKIYTFTFVISGSSVKVNVDIEDWTETQSNIDIYF
jgi:hypothetical protein